MGTLTAELTGADPGLLGVLTVEVRTTAAIVTPATTAGIEDLGAGAYRYIADLPAGDYIVRWDDGAGGTAEEGITVAAGTAPPAAGYVTPAELRAELELSPAELTDAAATRAIVEAEELVDGFATGIPLPLDAVRKFTLADLGPTSADAVRRAALILAAAAQRGDLAPNAASSVKGPDFELGGLTAGARSPAGLGAMRRARNLLSRAGLVVTSARARA